MADTFLFGVELANAIIPICRRVSVGKAYLSVTASYGEDVRGWIARAHKETACVWIAGHSEGGLVALEAARHRPYGLCGVILMSAPGRPIGDLLIEQLGINPMNAPLMKDLRAMCGHVADHARDLRADYGNISAASVVNSK